MSAFLLYAKKITFKIKIDGAIIVVDVGSVVEPFHVPVLHDIALNRNSDTFTTSQSPCFHIQWYEATSGAIH